MASITRTLGKIIANPGHIFNVASRLRMFFTRNSIFHTSLELSMAGSCPTKMLARMLELFQPRSILDLGQGTGADRRVFGEVGNRQWLALGSGQSRKRRGEEGGEREREECGFH